MAPGQILDIVAALQVVAGYCYGDSTCGQRAVYEMGMTGIPIINVNNNCATGSTALYIARNFIAGGIAQCILALGFEKMQPGSLGSRFDDRENPCEKHFFQMAEIAGVGDAPPMPQMFGNAGKEHMKRHGTTKEHLVKIAWKNHKHSVNNPYSQFRYAYACVRACVRGARMSMSMIFFVGKGQGFVQESQAQQQPSFLANLSKINVCARAYTYIHAHAHANAHAHVHVHTRACMHTDTPRAYSEEENHKHTLTNPCLHFNPASPPAQYWHLDLNTRTSIWMLEPE